MILQTSSLIFGRKIGRQGLATSERKKRKRREAVLIGSELLKCWGAELNGQFADGFYPATSTTSPLVDGSDEEGAGRGRRPRCGSLHVSEIR